MSGSNKAYGVSLVNEHSNTLVVFEAVIDMMSYLDVSLDYETNKLDLGCISDKALQQFLEDYPHITQKNHCKDWNEYLLYQKSVFQNTKK